MMEKEHRLLFAFFISTVIYKLDVQFNLFIDSIRDRNIKIKTNINKYQNLADTCRGQRSNQYLQQKPRE